MITVSDFQKMNCYICNVHTDVMVRVDYIPVEGGYAWSTLYCKDRTRGWEITHTGIMYEVRKMSDGNVKRIDMTDIFVSHDMVKQLRNAPKSEKLSEWSRAGLI